VRLHRLVTDRPGYRAITKERERVEQAWTTWNRRRSEADRDHKTRLTEWHAAQMAAVLAGTEAPPCPTAPAAPDGAAMAFETERMRLDGATRELLAREVDQIEKDLMRREGELLRQSATHARAIAEAAAELEELRLTAKGVRTVAGRPPGVYPEAVDAYAVMSAAARGTGFIDGAPRSAKGPITLTLARG
jgi:hypothetical protein